jgi:hypothetical protein
LVENGGWYIDIVERLRFYAGAIKGLGMKQSAVLLSLLLLTGCITTADPQVLAQLAIVYR